MLVSLRIYTVTVMTKNVTIESVLEAVDEQQVLELEQEAVRIPSPTFEEAKLAEYLADYMKDIGMEVELFEVSDPFESDRSSKQPMGRLPGTGDGPSLMFNGHMDHRKVVAEWDRDPFSGEFEDGWIHGRGSQDDKGGIVAAISAVESLLEADIRPKGDIIVCPVMGHKSGAIGSRDLINRGIIPDYCINTENSANGIANVCVGIALGWIHSYAKPTHFGSREPLKKQFFNPLEQISKIIQAIGPSLSQIPSDSWLSFEPHSMLSGYPQLKHLRFEGDARDEGKASLQFQVRLVPSQSTETVRTDLEHLLATLEEQNPGFETEIEMPPDSGQFAGWDFPAFETSTDSPLVQAQSRWHEHVTGSKPVVGAEPRLGSVGDGALFAHQGVKTILYGPGDTSIFPQWPTPNERISLEELVVATKAYAMTAVDLLGVDESEQL